MMLSDAQLKLFWSREEPHVMADYKKREASMPAAP
jgi:hypothetical protein